MAAAGCRSAQSRSAQAEFEAQIHTTRYAQAQATHQASGEAHSQPRDEESWQKRSKLGMAVNVLASAVRAEKRGQKRSKFGKAVNVFAGAVNVLNAVAPIMFQQEADQGGFLDATASHSITMMMFHLTPQKSPAIPVVKTVTM